MFDSDEVLLFDLVFPHINRVLALLNVVVARVRVRRASLLLYDLRRLGPPT